MIWVSASKALPFTFVVLVISASLKEVKHSSSLDYFLAFKARAFLSPLALTILESFLMIISWTFRFPMSSLRDSDVKSFNSSIAVTFALHLGFPNIVLARVTFIKNF
ncbi:hypothetical protein Tco_1455119 [Tanacetum coccineum]